MRWFKRLKAHFIKPKPISFDPNGGYICNGVIVEPTRYVQLEYPIPSRPIPKRITREDIVARKLALMSDEALFR